MNFKNVINKILRNDLNYISDMFSSNEEVCSGMLKIIDNKSTTIKIDKEIKNSYYVFINDTIYISDKNKNNTKYYRICMVAHECIHSIQNKVLQLINFILSNIELIGFILTVILSIFIKNIEYLFNIYIYINLLSIFVRLILEIDASIRSISLSEKYMKNRIPEKQLIEVINSYKLQMTLLLPLFLLSSVLGKILRFFVIYIIK